MRVFILGIAHGVQTSDGRCSGKQKAKYRDLLRQVIRHRSVEFVGEEISPGHPTFAEALTKALSIRWEPIDMTESDKKQIGVPERALIDVRRAEEKSCACLTEEGYQKDLHNGFVMVELRHDTDNVRDEFMFNCVISNSDNVKSALVICGYNHTIQLEQKFLATGHDVEHDALFNYEWFGP